MKVIKRDGSEVSYDANKIKLAINLANKECNNAISLKDIDDIVEHITNKVSIYNRPIEVEEIQDMVEKYLCDYSFKLGKCYMIYRYDHKLKREDSTLLDECRLIIENNNQSAKEENANKNPEVVSTQRDYLAGVIDKALASDIYSEDVLKVHKDGIIHIHDLDYRRQYMTNCGLVNLDDMLQNGTVINRVGIRKPHSFLTACTVATQIMAAVASSQYGGQSMTLTHLAKFIDISRQKIRRKVKDEVEPVTKSMSNNDAKVFIDDIVEKRLKDELVQGVQTIQYQILSLSSTNGQSPFITLFMYLNEAGDDQVLKDDLAMLIEEVLRQRIKGVETEDGHFVAPTFPKLIYVTEEDNITEDSRYWYLTKLAAECSNKRMVPDYISEKVMFKLKEGNCFPSMGCVSGDSTIEYMYKNNYYLETFEKMWDRLSRYYEPKCQYGIDNNPNLYIDLENVKIYDIINGFVNCKRIIRNVSSEWVEIATSNKRKLNCTVDHPMYTDNRGRVYASELRIGDTLLTNTTKGIIKSNIVSLFPYINKDEYSYDVTTDSDMFQVNDIQSHNCRSFLAPYKDENGKYKFYGRFNLGVCTINLVDVALSSHGNKEEFDSILDERLELCHKAQEQIIDHLKDTKAGVAPILWVYGAYARLNPNDTIESLFYNGYCSISLGYAGLYECVKYMTGESHTTEIGKEFGIYVMDKLNAYCDKWKEESKYHIGYSLYGTPLESTTYKFAKCLQKRFGIIEGITDRNYITNSYHIPVFEEINAFDKLLQESYFQEKSLGGAISYVELPSMTNYTEALESLIKYTYDTIMYSEFNTKIDYCHNCKYEGEIEMKQDNSSHKLIWKCPKCGCTDTSQMTIVRRVCGYLSSNDFNQGRMGDINDRVLHL